MQETRLGVTLTPTSKTFYPANACSCASTCLMCCCPASRANFSPIYAHMAVHPHEQVGRLTSRLPSFSGQTVMLCVTPMIVPLPFPETFCTRSTPDFSPVTQVYLGRQNTTPGYHLPAARDSRHATSQSRTTHGPVASRAAPTLPRRSDYARPTRIQHDHRYPRTSVIAH